MRHQTPVSLTIAGLSRPAVNRLPRKLAGVFGHRRARVIFGAGAALVHVACDSGTFVVNSTVDGAPGSLRAAIAQANLSTAQAIRIEIPSGTYELTSCASEDDSNLTGDLDLTTSAPVTIVATGSVVIRQTCPGQRVLDSRGTGALTLQNVVITGGSLIESDPRVPAQGGGLRVAGNLAIDGSNITGNTATGAPGCNAKAGEASTAGGSALGGGLYVGGALSGYGLRLSSNTARGGDGAAAAGTDGRGSAGGSAEGGGAYVVGSISIGPFVERNRAVGGKGGDAELWPGGGGQARGGGLAQAASASEPVDIPSAFFDGNSALGGDSGGMRGSALNAPGPLPPAGDASGGALAVPVLVTEVPVDEGQGSFMASHNLARGGSSGVGEVCPINTNCRSPAAAGRALGGAIASLSARLEPFGVVGIVGPIRFELNQAISGDTRACSREPCGAEQSAPAVAAGGAIWASQRFSSAGFTFTQNAVIQGLGAPVPGGVARGGAVASDGEAQTFLNTYTDNAAVGGHGGAIDAIRVQVQHPQAALPSWLTTFDGNRADGGGGAVTANVLEASYMRASGNSARGLGGGAIAALYSATIVRSTIEDNSIEWQPGLAAPPGGGGILVFGQLTISDSNVLGNTACAATPAAICSGGGIRAGQLVLDRVTVANNRVYGYSPAMTNADAAQAGGGAAITATSGALLINTTLSNNELVWTAPPPSGFTAPFGAAVLAQTLTLDHATAADNLGGDSFQIASLNTRRSVASAVPGQVLCAGAAAGASSYNVFGDASCGLSDTTDRVVAAPSLLAPLADNGGSVLTRLPAFSGLIDAIPVAACPVAVDARGVTRPQGAACDVGAVEASP